MGKDADHAVTLDDHLVARADTVNITAHASGGSDAFGGEKSSAPSLEMRDVATATP